MNISVFHEEEDISWFIYFSVCFIKSSFRGKRFSIPNLPDSSGTHPASYSVHMGGKGDGA